MNTELFKGKLVRLVSEDVQVISDAYSRWALDSEFNRLLESQVFHLWSPKMTGKWVERELAPEKTDQYYFMIRTLEGDRLIGDIGLDGIQSAHGDTFLGIGLGEREFWGLGYGTDALRCILRFAFTELNLRRVSLDVFEYNPRALRSYEKAGFVVEGRMRGMLKREGKRWDLIFMGILRDEWERISKENQ